MIAWFELKFRHCLPSNHCNTFLQYITTIDSSGLEIKTPSFVWLLVIFKAIHWSLSNVSGFTHTIIEPLSWFKMKVQKMAFSITDFFNALHIYISNLQNRCMLKYDLTHISSGAIALYTQSQVIYIPTLHVWYSKASNANKILALQK